MTPEQVARKMVEAFESAPIVESKVSDHSISKLSVRFGGKLLKVSWYPPMLFFGPAFRSFEYDGDPGLLPLKMQKAVFRAALARAQTHTAERFAKAFGGADTQGPRK